MKIWQIVVLGLLMLALVGCKSDPSTELLERDNWQKEQEIYRLRSENEELKESLNANAPAPRAVTRGVPPAETRSGEMPPEPSITNGGAADRTAPPATRPRRSNPEPDLPPAGGLQISPGMEAPAGEVPDRMKVPDSGAPPRSARVPDGPSTQWSPAGLHRLPASSLQDNSAVMQITLHPSLTGGIGSGGQADEGLLVVVEPRDIAGNIVNAPADINVALIDPALSGEQARLARWDFAAAQTQGMIRTGEQQGIHLRLPWVSTPAHDRLKVFVRYTTRDGKKLQAERLISVAVNTAPPLQHEAIPDDSPAQTATRPQRPQWSPLR